MLGNQKTVTRLLLRTDNCLCALGSAPGTEASLTSTLFCHKSCGEGSKAEDGQSLCVSPGMYSGKSSYASLEGFYCGYVRTLPWAQVHPPHHNPSLAKCFRSSFKGRNNVTRQPGLGNALFVLKCPLLFWLVFCVWKNQLSLECSNPNIGLAMALPTGLLGFFCNGMCVHKFLLLVLGVSHGG